MGLRNDDENLVIAANKASISDTIAKLNVQVPDGLLLVAFEYANLPAKLFDFCFNLVKSNLIHLYMDAQDSGWSDRGKQKEMRNKNGRYILAFKRQAQVSDTDSNSPAIISHQDYIPHESDEPVGYLYYVACMEDSYDDVDGGMNGSGKAPVIYCIELQTTPEVRNTGLGTVLMEIQEQTGNLLCLRRSMLTVFKKNDGAMRFYKRLGYSPDRISPSMCLSEKRAGRYSYEIMKKDLDNVPAPVNASGK
ncbi:N-alpha-acetyltransferase 40 [Podochytrium sp. JEL0797]|nr:N-alpha-acetyltransferase 40 [Podochytrium sp. JEL0797]